ncbi:MAG: LPS export ABC transporter periplasmic protein LptC [Pseudomonadota bacterium]
MVRIPPPSAAAARQIRALRYSRFVRAAKIVLPIGALLLVASIFFSGEERGGIEDLLSPEEIARLGAGLRLDRPRFAGTTDGGEPFELSASAALPDGAMPEEIGLEEPRGRLTLREGIVIEVEAEDGTVQRTAETLTLQGTVTITTSDGYRFATQELTLNMRDKDGVAPGAVRGSGPQGELEAGRMTILDGQDGLATARVIFEGGVRLLFTPDQND